MYFIGLHKLEKFYIYMCVHVYVHAHAYTLIYRLQSLKTIWQYIEMHNCIMQEIHNLPKIVHIYTHIRDNLQLGIKF